MKSKTRGSATASIALFVTSGLMASVLGLRQYDRVTSVPAWVTSAPVQAGDVLTQDQLTQSRIPRDEVGIDNPQTLVGKRLRISKGAGEAIQPGDLIVPAPPQQKTLAQHVPQGRVLYSLPLGNHATTPLSQLHAGDRLDVLVRGRNGVRTAATDVRLIGVLKPRGSSPSTDDGGAITSLLPQRSSRQAAASGNTTLVLAVQPEHVYPLAHIAAADQVSLVIHSALDVALGRQITVTPARTERPVEVVAGLERSTVYVNR
ncbi:SAF domain-containing protein [Abyssibacter sp.]|jgi:hypothetical protein|uniref:SAF domain-containing protein n=1 Tax=Abyssibacter sp. TaxID=2320200 RepID=UPI0025C5EC49|nr:SAF domain-containing protein [Abyssibacter sp.]MCK5860083.1 hypothetical protein [Abyssibacter sp.]